MGMTLPCRPQKFHLIGRLHAQIPRSCFNGANLQKACSATFDRLSHSARRVTQFDSPVGGAKFDQGARFLTVLQRQPFGVPLWPSKFASTRRSPDEIGVKRAACPGPDWHGVRRYTKATVCRRCCRRLRRELFNPGGVLQTSVPNHVQHAMHHLL
jgi:hypothetical protein